MCDPAAGPFAAPPALTPLPPGIPELPHGSRRRRVWELTRDCHCPVIGVCLPLAALRTLVNRATAEAPPADEYELHVGAVNACTTRNRVSEALQADLERRYLVVVRRFKAARSAEAIGALWREAVTHGDVAGAFWAALTHPRCDLLLEDALRREMHMIQHQVGASTRVERREFDALAHEHGVITRELARVQERCSRLLAERAREVERLTGEAVELRSALVGRDAAAVALHAELAHLQASVPDLAARLTLRDRLEAMAARQREQDGQLAALRRELALAREELESLRATPAAAPPGAAAETAAPAADLRDRIVLCVGGRSGNVADYRGVVERSGARFAHHDGGVEDSVVQLDASLAAADLVICQTGCISHGAYWRVKDHCKRTGKRCVFVDNPSVSSLSRSLTDQLGPGPGREVIAVGVAPQ